MSFVSSTECETSKFKTVCIQKLGDGFTFLKAYSLDKVKSDKIEYSFIFSKNVNYMLTCATDIKDDSKVEIQLYDKTRKLLFSNYNKKKDLYYTVNYSCSYTGVHYITFTHHDQNAKCGLSVLGFKRK